MKLPVRIFLSYVLCILIVVTGSPFQLYFEARAQDIVTPTSVEAPDAELISSIDQLREAFLNPEKAESSLDPFSLINQRVVDDRGERIEAVIQQEKIADYEARMTYYTELIAELEELRGKAQAKVDARRAQLGIAAPPEIQPYMPPQPEQTNENRAADLATELGREAIIARSSLPVAAEGTVRAAQQPPMDSKLQGALDVLLDIDSRLAMAQLELTDLKNYDPRKGKGLSVDLMIDTHLQTRHYWGRRMGIEVRQNGELVTQFNQSEFTESFSPEFNKENPLQEIRGDESKFTITDNKGNPLHEFFKSVEAIFFYGHYLVYIETDALNKSETVLPIRFIDLRFFKPNIGNSPLPVFTLPLNVTERPTTFSISEGFLKIGEQLLSYPQFDMLSKAHQILYNVNVALVDANAHKNAKPFVEEILRYFSLSMGSQEALFQAQMREAIAADPYLESLTESLSNRTVIDKEKASADLREAFKNGMVTDAEFKTIERHLPVDGTLIETNQALHNGRKLFTRMRLLTDFLMHPRPEGAPKLFNSLVMAATGGEAQRARVLEMGQESFSYKMAKYGLATGGVILAATYLPEPYTLHLATVGDFIGATFQHLQGYLSHMNYGKAYLELSSDAFITSTTGWTYFLDSYIADGKWVNFLIGLGNVLLIPLKLFGGSLIVTNSYKMFQKTLEMRRLSNGDLGFIASFRRAAIDVQNNYWRRSAEAEKKVSGSDVDTMTKDEIRLVSELIDRINSGRESIDGLEKEIETSEFRQRSMASSYIKTLLDYKKLFRFGKDVESAYEKTKHEIPLDARVSLPWAVWKSFFSYASIETSVTTLGTIWNYFFISRSFFWDPAKWMMLVTYPNYFNTTVTANKGQQHFPSKYNGGLELWPSKIHRALSRAAAVLPVSQVPGIQKMFLTQEALDNLAEFEKAVINAEIVAIEFAKKKAQKALIQSIRDPRRLEVMFDSAQREGDVSTGIRNLYDQKLATLTKRERIFYRAFFTRTFDVMMQRFVSELSSTTANLQMDPGTFVRHVARELRANNLGDYSFDPKLVAEMEPRIEQSVDLEQIRVWAEEVATQMDHFSDRANIQFRHRLLNNMHPQNGQIRRFLTAKEKFQDPRATQRAVRMEVADLFSSIPLGIVSALGLYAGVQTGVLQPFDANGLNTETHLLYMSRYLFYYGFIPGLIIGLMAGTWMKVQQDARIGSMGGFDNEIKFTDGQKGFWRNYFKNVFKNPNNKWKDNHIYYLKLIASNIQAAAVTIIIAQALGLGRIDVDVILSGYILAFTMFWTGFNLKTEQAYELASNWMRNKIPRKLRAHPLAMKKVDAMIQANKIKFSFWSTLYGTILIENVAGEMLTLKDNIAYGTRAFMRVVFGGDTPTIIISNFVDKLILTFHAVPGAEKLLGGVKHVFTNNYEAFDRFPDRLVEEGGRVIRVVENPALPENMAAEALGKTAALVGTTAAVTSIPYIIANASQRKRTRSLVEQGATIKASAPLRCNQLFVQ